MNAIVDMHYCHEGKGAGRPELGMEWSCDTCGQAYTFVRAIRGRDVFMWVKS